MRHVIDERFHDGLECADPGAEALELRLGRAAEALEPLRIEARKRVASLCKTVPITLSPP